MRVLVLLLAVLFSACGLLEHDTVSWPPSFDDVEPVIAASCNACHTSAQFDGLLAATEDISAQPQGLDSVPLLYKKQLVLEQMDALADKMMLYPMLDFSVPGNLDSYVNEIPGKRDVVCQRIQFRYFRPYHPQGMPPPYAETLARRAGRAGGAYVAAWQDSASSTGAWQVADDYYDFIINFHSSGAFYAWWYGPLAPLPTDSTTGFFRNDSVFSVKTAGAAVPETSLVSTFRLDGDTLRLSLTRAPGAYTKLTPENTLARYVTLSQYPAAWTSLGLDNLTNDQCVFCHSRADHAALVRSIAGLPDSGFTGRVSFHPGGIVRQFMSLGNAMMFVTTADFSKAGNLEKFLSDPAEANVTAQRLLYPLHHEWYPGSMPPPWTEVLLNTVDPGGRVFPYAPMSEKDRSLVLAYIESQIAVGPFNFDTLTSAVMECCNDAGVPFEPVANSETKLPPCSLVPFFPDE